jgi:hypothetical protein
MSEVTLSAFQRRALEVPERYDLFLGGGRGGGKSHTCALLALRHAEQYAARARVLYLRMTYKGLADFELICRELFAVAYGTEARYNQAEHVWRLPGGAFMELGQLEGPSDFAKYQGRSFTLLLVDEAGQYSSPDVLDLLRSNLRGPKDMPLRMIIAANPAGVGHHWLARRYVFVTAPWVPFREDKSGHEWVSCPSTLADNTAIDRAQYRQQLASACPSDPELLRAWIHGDWSVARGAYFASVLEESRVAVGPFDEMPAGWRAWFGHDFGSAAPNVTLLMVESPGQEFAGKYYPRGSVVIIDELAAYRRDNLNMGLGWTAATTAEAIRSELCEKWGVPPVGCADDAIFARTGSSAGSIAEEFARCGVRFQPAKKGDRISGWQRMRRMFADAGKPDQPGLYVSRACEYFWATVPYLARDQRRVEDVDSSGPDHAADATRYGLRYEHLAMSIDLPWAF